MKGKFAVAALFFMASTFLTFAQAPAVTHNTWTSGAPMPTPLGFTMAAVLEGQIYVVGGGTDVSCDGVVADTQIYNPSTDTWAVGVPLPSAVCGGAGAVVKNIFYVIGGYYNGTEGTNQVWAYSPKTKTWTSKSPMPTARGSIGAVVLDNIIYVIGGNGNNVDLRLNTVESYDPVTDAWTEEAPLLAGKSEPSVGLVKSTIVAADGETLSGDTGDNEGYSASANAWTSFNPDPTGRNGACGGGIGSHMYVAGGYTGSGPDLTLTESFEVSKNAWKTLAPLPQSTLIPGSAVYKGRLYCFGGVSSYEGGVPINNVQIYQP